MKRHPSLIPLSHDHHQCLMIANYIHLNTKKFKIEAQKKCLKLIEDKKEELLNHFKIEEDVLFPILLEYDDIFITITEELIDEHSRLKLLLQNAFEENHKKNLIEFKDLLIKHVRKEERIFFQLVQEKLNSERMKDMSSIITSSFITVCKI